MQNVSNRDCVLTNLGGRKWRTENFRQLRDDV